MAEQPITSAAGWFDQFAGYLAAHPQVQGSAQWCRRHWAPCPALGANGLLASVMLIQAFAEASEGGSADVMNAQMDAMSPLCCMLGDDLMYDIWGQCPPAAEAGEQP